MEVRSYYATSVETAMAAARGELGPEAMLVQSRQSPPDLLHLGRYEVVFAGEAQITPVTSVPLLEIEPWAQSSRTKMVEQPELAPRDLIGLPQYPPDPEAAGFLSNFVLECSSTKTVFPAVPPLSHGGPKDILAAPIRCAPTLGVSRSSTQTVALVGPSGAGRTSSIMKLALSQGLLVSRAVRLLAFDPLRVGANSQLRHFAGLLRLPFAEFDLEEELSSSLEDHFEGLTLIDTAGFGPNDGYNLHRLKRCFDAHPRLQCQLVLRADRTNAVNLAAVQRFSVLSPSRLILTALDEPPRLDGLRVLIARAALPISFLGVGQRIPEDLEAASPARLAQLIRDGWPAPVCVAA